MKTPTKQQVFGVSFNLKESFADYSEGLKEELLILKYKVEWGQTSESVS